jgi:hypothetical protein
MLQKRSTLSGVRGEPGRQARGGRVGVHPGFQVKLRRSTVLLAAVAVAVVAAAVAATFITRKPSAESKQRKGVAAYIDTVNLVQNQMHIQLTKVALAYRDLAAAGSIRRRHAPAQLGAAAATLRRLDQRLIATPAPPEASKLRSLVIKLVAQQAALTREVQELALFTPRFSVYVTRLRAISARFNNAMGAVVQPKRKAVHGTRAQVAAAERAYAAAQSAAAAAQANAIAAYVGDISALLKELRTLVVPTVVAPTFDAEMRSLHDITVTGTRLAAELRTPNRTHLNDRIRAFTLAGREAGDLAVQRAQIAAIRAYNRRSRAVGTTASAVQDELARLGRVLP